MHGGQTNNNYRVDRTYRPPPLILIIVDHCCRFGSWPNKWKLICNLHISTVRDGRQYVQISLCTYTLSTRHYTQAIYTPLYPSYLYATIPKLSTRHYTQAIYTPLYPSYLHATIPKLSIRHYTQAIYTPLYPSYLHATIPKLSTRHYTQANYTPLYPSYLHATIPKPSTRHYTQAISTLLYPSYLHATIPKLSTRFIFSSGCTVWFQNFGNSFEFFLTVPTKWVRNPRRYLASFMEV